MCICGHESHGDLELDGHRGCLDLDCSCYSFEELTDDDKRADIRDTG